MTTGVTLIIARHGNTFGPGDTPVMVGIKTDLALTEQGQQQAKAIGQDLKNIHASACYTGFLTRQRQTADGIQSQLDQTPSRKEIPCLNEIDYGPWEGLTPAQVQEQWPIEFEQWEKGMWQDSLFQETGQDRQTQLQSWLQEVQETYPPGHTVLGVTSGGVLKMLHQIIKPHTTVEKVKTGHYCIVQLEKEKLGIKGWNLKPGHNHGDFN